MKYKVLYSVSNTGWEDAAEVHFSGLFTDDEKICDFVSKALKEKYKDKDLRFDKVHISESGLVLHQVYFKESQGLEPTWFTGYEVQEVEVEE